MLLADKNNNRAIDRTGSSSNSMIKGSIPFYWILLKEANLWLRLQMADLKDVRSSNRTAEGGRLCGNVRYNTHLYCLTVQAGFYSDAVECLTATQEILVRSSARTKGV